MDVGAHSPASSDEILVYGSRRLSRVLIGMGLVEELRLLVYPVVLGAGGRLFGETQDKIALRGRIASAREAW
jgi:dihydrofolate reductase